VWQERLEVRITRLWLALLLLVGSGCARVPRREAAAKRLLADVVAFYMATPLTSSNQFEAQFSITAVEDEPLGTPPRTPNLSSFKIRSQRFDQPNDTNLFFGTTADGETECVVSHRTGEPSAYVGYNFTDLQKAAVHRSLSGESRQVRLSVDCGPAGTAG
jgi:hypothetical protein